MTRPAGSCTCTTWPDRFIVLSVDRKCPVHGDGGPWPLGSDELRAHVRDMVELATTPKPLDVHAQLALITQEIERRRETIKHVHQYDEECTDQCVRVIERG